MAKTDDNAPKAYAPEAFDLDALFAADLPPAHDADFVVAVAARAARRRMLGDLAWAALVTAISALILWAVGPVIGPVLQPVSTMLLMFMPILATIAAVLILVHPRAAV